MPVALLLILTVARLRRLSCLQGSNLLWAQIIQLNWSSHVTREYYLEMTEATVATDDYSRPAMAVNGNIHGLVLLADEDDWFAFQYIFHIRYLVSYASKS